MTGQALAVSDPSGETVRTLLKDFYDARTGFRKWRVKCGFQGCEWRMFEVGRVPAYGLKKIEWLFWHAGCFLYRIYIYTVSRWISSKLEESTQEMRALSSYRQHSQFCTL